MAVGIFSELASIMGAEADQAGSSSATSGNTAVVLDVMESEEELQALPVCKKLVVLRESEDNENRCAITPKAACNLRKLGFDVSVHTFHNFVSRTPYVPCTRCHMSHQSIGSLFPVCMLRLYLSPQFSCNT
jgi:hypothetical protein